MQVVDPSDQLGRLHALDLEVEYETILAATREHTLQLQIRARVDFLMRNVGGHVDEITGSGFGFSPQRSLAIPLRT
jgi:hypothetical protein